ncbi:olfactory receptor 52N1-like [Lepisosteus oculatus]|uniref:olfactory receptor 52N1-like n=1 Tax=Lepisosteus oculatus TaxID=7918 RepID=UPI0037233E53
MEINTTFSTPVGFLISGFQNLQHSDYYFIFLAFVYLGTVVANFFLMYIIWVSECFHTPKYIAVFNLSVVDVSISTALIPKCIHQFLFESKFVSYETCLTQMLFVHFLHILESFSLVVMGYERLITICFPLRSSTINTNSRMIFIIGLSYVCIIAALSRISSAQGRWKAFKTCMAHLALVAMYFIPILVTYMIGWSNVLVDTNTRILNTSLSMTLPPLLNPIIYTLKTEEGSRCSEGIYQQSGWLVESLYAQCDHESSQVTLLPGKKLVRSRSSAASE